jgi:hypothetical protein
LHVLSAPEHQLTRRLTAQMNIKSFIILRCDKIPVYLLNLLQSLFVGKQLIRLLALFLRPTQVQDKRIVMNRQINLTDQGLHE